jgi:hypothetical protein
MTPGVKRWFSMAPTRSVFSTPLTERKDIAITLFFDGEGGALNVLG